MSVLVDKLRRLCDNASQPLGFRPAQERYDKQMVLIAALTAVDSTLLAQLGKADVDAVLAHGRVLEGEEQALEQFGRAAGDTPWGMWLEAVDESSAERLKKVGADFVFFEASAAPGALLQEEAIGKVLRVELPRDETLIGAVNEMSVDVIVVGVKKDGAVLTVADLMRCQWLAAMVDRPLLVTSEGDFADNEVRSLWEAGVKGLVVQVKEKRSWKSLAAMSEAIKSLPRKRKKHGRGRAVLPALGDVSGLDEDD